MATPEQIAIIQKLLDKGTSDEDIQTVVDHWKAQGKPIAADEPGTYLGGFLKGGKEGMVGGAKGFFRGIGPGLKSIATETLPGIVNAGVGLAKGAVNFAKDPGKTLAEAAAGASSAFSKVPALYEELKTLAATDPEAFGKSVGEFTANAEGMMALAALVPLLPKPMALKVGTSLERVGKTGEFAAYLTGAHQLAGGDPKGLITLALPGTMRAAAKPLIKFGTKPSEIVPLAESIGATPKAAAPRTRFGYGAAPEQVPTDVSARVAPVAEPTGGPALARPATGRTPVPQTGPEPPLARPLAEPTGAAPLAGQDRPFDPEGWRKLDPAGRAPGDTQVLADETGVTGRTVPTATREPYNPVIDRNSTPPSETPSPVIDKAARAQLKRQGYSDETIARIEAASAPKPGKMEQQLLEQAKPKPDLMDEYQSSVDGPAKPFEMDGSTYAADATGSHVKVDLTEPTVVPDNDPRLSGPPPADALAGRALFGEIPETVTPQTLPRKPGIDPRIRAIGDDAGATPDIMETSRNRESAPVDLEGVRGKAMNAIAGEGDLGVPDFEFEGSGQLDTPAPGPSAGGSLGPFENQLLDATGRTPKVDLSSEVPASKSKRGSMSATPGLTRADVEGIGMNPDLPIKKLTKELAAQIKANRASRASGHRTTAGLNKGFERALLTDFE